MTEREWDEIDDMCAGSRREDDAWCCDAFAEKVAREWLEARDVWSDQLRDGHDGWRYLIARQRPKTLCVFYWHGPEWAEWITGAEEYATRDAALLDAVRLLKKEETAC